VVVVQRVKARRWSLLGVLLSSLLFAACGSDEGAGEKSAAAEPAVKKTSKASFMLDFAYYGGHAPFALTVEREHYKAAGLDVAIQPGQGSTPTIQAVAAGKVDFGYASSLALAQLKAKDPSVDVKVIAQINQTAPWYVAYIKGKGISSTADLAGKSWAAPPGSAPEAFYRAFMAAKGLKLGKFIGTQAFDQALLAGQVDVVADSLTAYPYLVEAAKAKKIETDYFLLAEDAPEMESYSWGIIARADTLEKRPDDAKAFVDATLKGWSDAGATPADAVKAFHRFNPTAKDESTTEELKYMMLLVTSDAACEHGMGWTDDAEAQRTAEIGAKNAGAATPADPKSIWTNDFLPSKPYIPANCD
jgi:NitT/TauT family transport system substrate-binding protein